MTSPPKVIWTGKSGTKYTFNLYPIGTNFKAIAGVYIFTKQRVDKKWRAIYIGETEDLSTRFDDHHKMDCIEDEGATHICILSVGMGKKKDRQAVEADLIASENPPCNG